MFESAQSAETFCQQPAEQLGYNGKGLELKRNGACLASIY